MLNDWVEVVVGIIAGVGTIGTLLSFVATVSNVKKSRIDPKRSASADDAFTAEFIQLLDASKTEENSSTQNLESNVSPSEKFKHFWGYLAIQKRYYETNLAQTRTVFFIGIVLLFIGITMITVGVASGLSAKEADTITMLLTFSAGVLVDFIGTIFVAIYAKTLETAATYQKYISRVSNSLLARDLIKDISDPALQQQAIADIAKNLCLAEK